tara:strand:- start:6248 stop:6967 length:720 start_codon:yes stop_codon:yes gene_type:complete
MTYTVIAKCEENGCLGVAIATYSIAVGGYCPFFLRNRAVLSTQAFANPALGPLAIEALSNGRSPTNTILELSASDPDFDYRQVGIIDQEGSVGMHTGAECRNWAGHEILKGAAIFGNVLASHKTIEAMVKTFEKSEGIEFGKRLILTLEAGRNAGGQASSDGLHLPERSAVLSIQTADIVQDIDLRVDFHNDAVTELRRVYEGYSPYIEYYMRRARDPKNTPAQDAWVKEKLNDDDIKF